MPDRQHSRSHSKSTSKSRSRSKSKTPKSKSKSKSRSKTRSRSRSSSHHHSRSRSPGHHHGSNSRSRSRGRSQSGSQSGDEEGFRVHVADLGIDCSKRELEKIFEKYGETDEVWLARNPPCFAFIVYKRKEDADDAIRDMDGQVVCGGRVRVSFARPRTRGRRRRGFDPNMRCYQCGEKGHFSRDCQRSRGYTSNYGFRRNYNRRERGGGGGGGGGGYERDRYRRSRTRSRSRSRDRYRRRSDDRW